MGPLPTRVMPSPHASPVVPGGKPPGLQGWLGLPLMWWAEGRGWWPVHNPSHIKRTPDDMRGSADEACAGFPAPSIGRREVYRAHKKMHLRAYHLACCCSSKATQNPVLPCCFGLHRTPHSHLSLQVTVVLESADDMRVLQLLQMAEIVARTVPDISLPPGSALLPLGPASVQGAPGPAVTAGAHNVSCSASQLLSPTPPLNWSGRWSSWLWNVRQKAHTLMHAHSLTWHTSMHS